MGRRKADTGAKIKQPGQQPRVDVPDQQLGERRADAEQKGRAKGGENADIVHGNADTRSQHLCRDRAEGAAAPSLPNRTEAPQYASANYLHLHIGAAIPVSERQRKTSQFSENRQMRAFDSGVSVPRRGHIVSMGRHAVAALTACAATTAGHSAAHAQTAPADQPKSDKNDKPDTVNINGLRPLLHDKLPEDLQDTPQSITVITDKLMKEQATTRLQDALRNVPGITLNSGEGAARGDTVNLRGFSAFNDFFLDGIRDAAVYTRDSFNLENVEVVKGPSAILFGRGSTGGAINQVSKAANLAPLRSATLEAGTNSEWRGTADVNAPISPSAAVRLNAMGETSEVADRDDVRNRRWGIAPSLALGIGEDTSLTLSYLHQEEHNILDTGIPFVAGRPAPVPRNFFYGLASAPTTTEDDIVTARAKHDFNENLSLSDTLRWANYDFNFLFAAPVYGNSVPTASTPLSSILVGRDAPDSRGTQTNLTNQTDLTGRFTTGIFSHVLVAGVEVARQTSDIGRYNNPFNSNNNWIPRTPLLNPNPNVALPAEPIASQQNTSSYSLAGYATDTIGVGKYVDLIAGIRVDRFAARFDQLTKSTGATLHLSRTDEVPSPRAALVVKPTPLQSYYVSYGTSFDPSAEALTLTTKTAGLGPVKAKTYETGAKTGWLGGQLSVTGALFRTQVDNAQTNDPDNPTVTVLAGNQRVDGFELGVSGYLTPELEIFAGYTYLDAITVESGTANQVGKFIPNAARHSANLWAVYDINDDWKVGGGGNWLGRRYADLANTTSIPAYVVLNAMLSYRINDNVTAQLNAANLLDKKYYDNPYYTSAAENHVLPGAGRTVKLTTTFQF